MNARMIYQCEYCKEEYDTVDEALDCESTHVSISSISHKYELGTSQPTSINIIFDDNTSATFLNTNYHSMICERKQK